MSRSLNKPREVQRRRPVYAGFLLGLFLCVLGVAQLQTLHQALHCNACEPDHQCAATMLSSGLVDLAEGPCDTFAYTFTTVAEIIPDASLAPALVAFLPFTRGPPVFPA